VQRCFHFRPQTARHRIQLVGDFVDPATLLASFREDLT